MKVALVHDYIKEYGGAERVLEALHEIYPKAPVYTSVYLPSYLGPHRERFQDWDIRPSWLQYIPFKAKLISPMRLLAPFAFRSFDFSDYDVVIVSATGAYFPNTIKTKDERPKTKNQKPIHVCYCHTPPRYLYGYATAREWKKNVVFRVLGAVANHVLRMVDYNASKNVDYYIANSEEVASRIRKFYRRDATIIYPPVDINPKSEARNPKQIQNTKYEIPNTSYYLAGGRLARPKHIDLIIKACLELDLPLKVFGKGFAGYGDELHSLVISSPSEKSQGDSHGLRPQNDNNSKIEFLGEVTDEEKWELMSNAKAYINASEDEDFGILPVEAMAAGIPVIAYRSGGVRETVVEGSPSTGHSTLRDETSGSDSKSSGSATGLFFDDLTVESLMKAIKQFNNLPAGRQGAVINPSECQKRAEKFSKERFEKEIKQFVEKVEKK